MGVTLSEAPLLTFECVVDSEANQSLRLLVKVLFHLGVVGLSELGQKVEGLVQIFVPKHLVLDKVVVPCSLQASLLQVPAKRKSIMGC